MSIRAKLERDVGQRGEVHAAVDGYDDDLDLRKSQVEFDDGVFHVKYPDTGKITVPYSSVLYWYSPGGPAP